MTAHRPSDRSLADLAAALGGSLTLPSDPTYDAERSPWNLSVEQRPAAIAHPRDVDDLRTIVSAARDAGTTVAVQPSGHGATHGLEGSILTRMSAFDTLEIDADARLARIGAGVRWGAVLDALSGTGLAAPAGTSIVVSAAGYTLGGGHSWLSRTTGLGAQSLRAVWILRPDGTHERVDDASDPDTMWALRGAGGTVGIVTELEVELLAAPELHSASMTFAASDGPAVLRTLRDAAATTPAGLNVFVSSMRMPDAPMLPEAVRGRSFVSVEALALSETDLAVLETLRAAAMPEHEQVGPTTQAAMAAASMEPTDPSPSRGGSIALASLDDKTIDALFAFHAEPAQQALVGVSLRLLGGALDAPARPAFATLEGASWLVMGLAPQFPGMAPEPGAASLAGLDALLRPVASERMVPTFLAEHETLERCAPAAELARLRSIRDAADPDGLLHPWRLPR